MYGQKEWCGNDQNHFTKSVKERYEYCNEIEQWTHTLPSRDAVSDRTPPQTWRSSTTAPPSLLQQKPASSVLPKVAPASTRVAKSHHVGRQATAYGSSHQIEVSSKSGRMLAIVDSSRSPQMVRLRTLFAKQPAVTFARQPQNTKYFTNLNL